MTEKMPRGVEINGKQLRVSFMLNGQRCREPLPGIVKINKASIAYADNKRRTILAEIKEGRFDYAAHFPESPRALIFSGRGGKQVNRTVSEGVTRWLEVMKAKKAASTSRNYGHKAKHVIDKFGRRRIVDVSMSDLELFQAGLLKTLAPKTVNDVFTVVRGVWGNAFSDGIITSNPMDRIKNIEQDDSDDSADPFSREEIARIAAVSTTRVHDINMIMFWCWSGLSLSELIGLGWDDIDLDAGTAMVKRARVESIYKVPKEKSRVRKIDLIDPAVEHLKRQREATYLLPPVPVEIVQRDNVKRKKEAIRFVFRNGSSGMPWNPASVNRWFTGILKRAKVRHRGPNQCRHTFASQALSSYVPIEWVARQLGHTDTGMVKKHYGRWIPEDTKSMAGMVSQMMGFRDQSGAEGS